MNLETEIKINKFAQGIYENREILNIFKGLDLAEKVALIEDIIFLILQSKCKISDVTEAIKLSGLKSTFTPCIMLGKDISQNNLFRISKLPENELNKVFLLFINFFKIGYIRRYKEENKTSNKWWYLDLSKEKNINTIINKSNGTE